MFFFGKQKTINNSYFSSNSNKGFAALFITLLVLVIFFSIIVSILNLTLGEQKISRNIVASSKAYYAAEAGTEDALLRLINSWPVNPYNLNINDNTANVDISGVIGGSRTITATGDAESRIRKVRTVYAINTDNINFRYGVQAGDGGIIMENNSRIIGNVFSNGSVICSQNKAYITNNVTVAQNGRKIEKIEIGDPDPLTEIDKAKAHTCNDCLIHGELYYVSGGSAGNCVAEEGINVLPGEISPGELPISSAQIQDWKNEASCDNSPSCIFSGDYTIAGGTTDIIGPLKIEGSLILENNAILEIEGTIYVTGTITLNQGSSIRLESDYGSSSGVIIADDIIDVQNGVVIEGSGQANSYTMLLSMYASVDEDDPAINVDNNADGAIFYTVNGVVRLRNNIKIREATGYQIYLDQNAIVEYETGLENANFSSGPGGSWEVVSWQEIE